MNLRTIVLPVLAVAGLVATVAAVKKMEFRTLDVPVPVSPAPSPFESRIAATGLVEPLGGVTYVDAADAGVVGRVAVAEGDAVKVGDILWELDHARTRAELGLAEAEPRREHAGCEKCNGDECLQPRHGRQRRTQG